MTRRIDFLKKVDVYSGKIWSQLETFMYITQSAWVNIGKWFERRCLHRIHYAATWQQEHIEIFCADDNKAHMLHCPLFPR